MIRLVELHEHETLTLEDYGAVAHLAGAVRDLQAEAATLVPALEGRTIWMVNSTDRGGGVAEMLPRMVAILEELGVDVRWVVMSTKEEAFFPLTKRIHNLVHGTGDPNLTEDDKKLYEKVSRENASEMKSMLGKDDVLVIHDPQPLGMGAILKKETGIPTLWRCHIGLEERTEETEAVWAFLKPWAEAYDYALFSTPEYIPGFLTGKASVIHPAIDPLTHKNRELSPHRLMGILCNAGLTEAYAPVLTPPFEYPAKRLQPDGRWMRAADLEEIGLMYRTTVTQISRWDRLKGWSPLLDAFVELKGRRDRVRDPRHRRRLEIARLVLAGPDPAFIQDDPEGAEVVKELSKRYLELPAALQRDVVLLTLPMHPRKENALMVNALQRCATIAVQNSIQEGFGLTATEAMWKRVPMMVSQAAGLRAQVRDGIDGRLVPDATDPEAIADVLDAMLADPVDRDRFARAAQRRVHDEFLVFTQLRRWLETITRCLRGGCGS